MRRTGFEHPEETRAERREVHQELSRAYRGIDAIRTFLWTAAVVAMLVALMGSGVWRVDLGPADATRRADAEGASRPLRSTADHR